MPLIGADGSERRGNVAMPLRWLDAMRDPAIGGGHAPEPEPHADGRSIAALSGVPTVYREAAGAIHGFVKMRETLPSAVGDVAGCLAQPKLMLAEAAA